MFAARRKLRVIGRTRILVLSINTKNILSQFGAPSGKRCATDCLGDFIILDIIILINLYINIILYDGLVQKYSDVKLIRIIRLVLNIIVILGIKQDDENGSKDEKMSVIIKT